MILAACDLGSNSIKLTVARIDGDAPEVLFESATVTRIGQGLGHGGRLADEAVARTLDCLREFVEQSKLHGAERIGVVATAGLRAASDASEFVERVRHEIGVEIEIIDGLREAALTFRVPSERYGPGPVAVIDVGGRSTEIVSGTSGQLDARVSLELGGVRLTEQFIGHDPPQPRQLDACRDSIRATLADAPPLPAGAQLVGVSGTVLALLGVDMDLDDMGEVVRTGEGRALSLTSVRAIYEDLRRMTTQERLRGSVIPAGRADVIVAGAAIVDELMTHYGVDALTASNFGVRYGLLAELAADASGGTRPGPP